MRKKRVRIWNTNYNHICIYRIGYDWGCNACISVSYLKREWPRYAVLTLTCLNYVIALVSFYSFLFSFFSLYIIVLWDFFFLIWVPVHFNGCVLLTNKKSTKVVHVTINYSPFFSWFLFGFIWGSNIWLWKVA